MWHRQCTLEKKVSTSCSKFRITWIPEKFAIIGRFLELQDNGVWENGWKVIQIGARKGSEEVNERSRDYKKQRKASDRERPKKVKK